MDSDELRAWYDDYLAAFAACARRDADVRSLLAFYGVPLTVTTDAGAVTLTTEDQVASTVQGQVEALHAQGFHASVVEGFVVTPINASSALVSAALSRRTADGDEVDVVAMSYLVTEGPDPRRITVMAVHAGS